MKFFDQPVHVIISEFILATIALIGFFYNFWKGIILICIILLLFWLPINFKWMNRQR